MLESGSKEHPSPARGSFKAQTLIEYADSLLAGGDHTGAYKAILAATRSDAGCMEAWIRLGDALTANGKAALAVLCHRKALALDGSALNYLRYANAMSNVLEYDVAEHHFRGAIARDPTLSKAWYGLAVIAMSGGRLDEAREFIDRAMRLDPAVPDIRYCSALIALQAGDWQRGFAADYETRFQIKGGSNKPPNIADWNGESLRDKHLHVYAEQGFGDVILMLRFLRYLPHCRLSFLVPGEMRSLIERSINRSIAYYSFGTLPENFTADYCVALGSIPRLVMAAGRKFTVESRPYLFATDHPPLARPDNIRKTVGVVWAGDPRHPNDRYRSATAEDFVLGLSRPGIELYSLQVGDLKVDAALFGDMGLMQALPIRNWDDTAALIKQLDCVVGVDTGVTNLCGALGTLGHVLVAYGGIDWRWMHGVEQSPWYESITIHRQRKGETWRQVLERVPL